MRLIDHTELEWAERYDRLGRPNGAATYSAEIVRHQVPIWRERDDERSVVSTCPLLRGPRYAGLTADTVVQYLHAYSYDEPLAQARQVKQTVRARRLIFVTAYRSLHEQLLAARFRSIHIPMTVDTAAVRRQGRNDYGKRPADERVAVIYGNLTRHKAETIAAVNAAASETGWTTKHISTPEPSQAWKQLSRYHYGIGVGRSALEMMTLGLRVMYAGAAFGGIATTPEELSLQAATNYNGRVVTFDRDPRVCFRLFNQAIQMNHDHHNLIDSRHAVDLLKAALHDY